LALIHPPIPSSYFFSQLIEQEAVELKNKFSNPRRSMLEDSDSGQLEDIDVIPNEEMLLVIGFVNF
jgi:DNA gyrase/topoisomerase IV subunit A